MADEHLNLTSAPPDPPDSAESPCRSRKFLGVHFACCGSYARVYLNRKQTAYEGYCPKCARPVRFRIGKGGTDCRFFTAY